MTVTDPATRNGVDTAALFATIDVVRESAGSRPVPVPGDQFLGVRNSQPQHD